MRISTRGEYGLRAVLDLALHGGKGPIALKLIAERQDISEHYLEQLMGILRKAGIVTSVRGAQGGYRLAAPAAELRVLDVLEALEGPIQPRTDGEPPAGAGLEQVARYGTRFLLDEIAERLREFLAATTVDDLCRHGAELQARDSAYVYHI